MKLMRKLFLKLKKETLLRIINELESLKGINN